MNVRVLLVVACACRSGDREGKPPPAPLVASGSGSGTDAQPRPTFIRVPAAEARGAYYMREAPGERVGNMPIVGTFMCRLATQFGAPDPYVDLFHDRPPQVGFPLRHAATGVVFVAYPESYGYAGFDENAQFNAAVDELDALLAATTPRDCEYTFAGAYRVNRAGVRSGTPFFEHLDFEPTLDYRLAQLAYNDEHGDERKEWAESQLCDSLQQNWRERRDDKGRVEPGKAMYSRRDEVERRLLRCLETELVELETEVAQDWFDYDAVPGMVEDTVASFKDLDLDEPALAQRVQRLRATTKRKTAALRRGRP